MSKRRVRLTEVTKHAGREPGTKRPARRGRPRNVAKHESRERTCGDDGVGQGDGSARLQLKASLCDVEGAEMEDQTPENGSKHPASGRLGTAFCRLCHGKFSPRSLRHVFGKQQGESVTEVSGLAEKAAQSPLLFCADFQRLVGVALNRDPRLSQFVCKNCHAQFYRCHGILRTFLQRVNLSPSTGRENTRDRSSSQCSGPREDFGSWTSPMMTYDTKCLHSLVSWTHQHASSCHSCPDLKEVLEDQCCGSVRAVWGCVDGHSHVMDTQAALPKANPGHAVPFNNLEPEGEGHGEEASQKLKRVEKPVCATPQPCLAAPHTHGVTPGTEGSSDGLMPGEERLSPAHAQSLERTADSDLSDRNSSSDVEYEEKRKSGDPLFDDLFEPYPEKRLVSPVKRNSEGVEGPPEPKVRKKPGPKPGWKKKIKSEREELPNIYKCPHQGCTAVYRGADGMKKHIKEHHEEVRERPCPHPGCNKVFMIDRYLQRHVKLIHTEVRNYICDQCGQTFKQRKHLSVHQMRHSGAKPLQCEVCGFQCRQRASLKYHMTKHTAESDLEFACDLCAKRFEKAHNLNVHMSMVHPLTQGGGNPPDMLSDQHTLDPTGPDST